VIRVMLSGASGFVGKHFLNCLDASTSVLEVSLRKESGVTEILESVFDTQKLENLIAKFKPHRFYHLAGLMKGQQAEEFYRINLLYAKSIFEAVSAVAPETEIIVIGSGAEYARDLNHTPPYREQMECVPKTNYGLSKLLQTTLGLRYANQGLNVFIPRIFNLVGPCQGPDFVVGRAVQQCITKPTAKDAGPITFGDLSGLRDFLDVRDVCAILWELPKFSEARGRILNICSGEPRPVRELVDEVYRQTGTDLELLEAPSPEKGSDHHWGNNEKLKQVMEIAPTLSVRCVIRDMIAAENRSLREG